MRRSAIVLVVALAVALTFGVVPTEASSAKGKPIVLVHGFAHDSGNDCNDTWDHLRDALNNTYGWGGDGTPIVDVAYYKYDTRCAHSIDHHGSHRYVKGTDWRSWTHVKKADGSCCAHTADTPIEHLSFHLAWYIDAHFDAKGQCIEAIAHSMGGVVLRYAIAQVENGHNRFPVSICVEDVVTFASPHAGTETLWQSLCDKYQCEQMDGRLDCRVADSDGNRLRSISDFVWWLRNHALDPDATGGTQWTVMGSQNDDTVTEWCAVRNIAAYHRFFYHFDEGIEHSHYPHRTGTPLNYTARHTRGCCHCWEWHNDFRRPVNAANRAMARSDF